MLRVKQFLWLLCFFPCVLLAAKVHLNPIRVKFEPGQTTESFKMMNADKAPVLFQLKVLKWTQEAGKDVLVDTKDIILNPPIVNIQGDSYQLVRVGFRAPLNPKNEHTYRIIATQLPAKNESGAFQVQPLIRFSIPIFVDPKEKFGDFRVDTRELPNGDLELHLANKSNYHIQITNVEFYENNNEKPMDITITKDKFFYLLPDQSKTLPLKWKHQKGMKDIVLKINTDRGLTEVPVKITQVK